MELEYEDEQEFMSEVLSEISLVKNEGIDLAPVSYTHLFPDIAEHVDFFEAVPEYDISMYAHKKMKTSPESSLEVLKDILPRLEAQEDYSNDALYAMLCEYVKEKEYKNGYVMWPIRTAVSGKQMTPGGATELMEALGKEESISRIKAAIEKLAKEL